MKHILKFILRLLPFIIVAGLAAAILFSEEKPSVEGVIKYLPENIILSCVILLVMYTIKGMSIVFPILVLQIAAGIILPLWLALIINILGTALSYTVPFFVGRLSGAESAEKMIKKYPKIRDAVDFQRSSDWFISFILRAVSCLPADIVSMYLGSIGISFFPYLTASVIGTLPGLIPATFVGMNFMNPMSPEFIISVIITLVTSLASVIIYYMVRKRAGNINR